MYTFNKIKTLSETYTIYPCDAVVEKLNNNTEEVGFINLFKTRYKHNYLIYRFLVFVGSSKPQTLKTYVNFREAVWRVF